MARIRTVKPEFWSDDKLGPLDALTRLVFLGLVSQADDAGRLPDSVKRLNGLLFPFTDEDCGPCIELLSTLGVVSRGSAANGQRIIQIAGWSRHQYIEKPNMRAALPPIVPPSKVRRRIPDDSGNDRGGFPDESPGEVEVEVEGINCNPLGGDPDPRAREGASLDGFTPTAEHRAIATELGLFVDELLRDWRLQRKASGTEPADLDADFERWIRREPGFRRDAPETRDEQPPPSKTWQAQDRGPTEMPKVPWDREPEGKPMPAAELGKLAHGLAEQLKPSAAKNGKRHADEPAPAPTIDDPAKVAEMEANRKAGLRALEAAKAGS